MKNKTKVEKILKYVERSGSKGRSFSDISRKAFELAHPDGNFNEVEGPYQAEGTPYERPNENAGRRKYRGYYCSAIETLVEVGWIMKNSEGRYIMTPNHRKIGPPFYVSPRLPRDGDKIWEKLIEHDKKLRR